MLPRLKSKLTLFLPCCRRRATVMMMGTFPPKEDKRAMQFHYPNFQNDMWRIYGLVFFNDAAYFQRPSEKHLTRRKSKHSCGQRVLLPVRQS